jgi:hypothetical protein
VLVLADTQIVAGIAILVSGYASLDRCLSLYHWKILVDLAWFSSTTHLSALTLLRNHFHNHPGQRAVRGIFMGCMLVLLAVALIPTSHLGQHFGGVPEGAYAKCFFKSPGGAQMSFGSGQLFIPSVLLVTYAYVVRAAKLFGGFAEFGTEARKKAGRMAVRAIEGIDQLGIARYILFRVLVQIPVLATYVTIRFILDFLFSMTAEVSVAEYQPHFFCDTHDMARCMH